jgi:hypothetical protein
MNRDSQAIFENQGKGAIDTDESPLDKIFDTLKTVDSTDISKLSKT